MLHGKSKFRTRCLNSGKFSIKLCPVQCRVRPLRGSRGEGAAREGDAAAWAEETEGLAALPAAGTAGPPFRPLPPLPGPRPPGGGLRRGPRRARGAARRERGPGRVAALGGCRGSGARGRRAALPRPFAGCPAGKAPGCAAARGGVEVRHGRQVGSVRVRGEVGCAALQTSRPSLVPLSPNGGAPPPPAPPSPTRGRPHLPNAGARPVPPTRGGSPAPLRPPCPAGLGPPPLGGGGGGNAPLVPAQTTGERRVRGRGAPVPARGSWLRGHWYRCGCSSRLARSPEQEGCISLRAFIRPATLSPRGRSLRAFLQRCRALLGLPRGAAGSEDLLPRGGCLEPELGDQPAPGQARGLLPPAVSGTGRARGRRSKQAVVRLGFGLALPPPLYVF